MSSLFDQLSKESDAPRPLADRLRPEKLEDILGQDHLLGEAGVLTKILANNTLGSIILWGPPGTGKTTLARCLSSETGLSFEPMSAIFSGVSDLRKIFDTAKARRMDGRGTLLFVDEIHRFNRAQQDAFLPVMEDGTITLVGATTENPSFELNAALLSRAQVLTLNRLDKEAIMALMMRAEKYMQAPLPLTEEAREELAAYADGDGRFVLNLVEDIYALTQKDDAWLTPDQLGTLVARRASNYDKDRDGHYNLISALHKSVRGSDPQAALYWLARMLTGGEDPLYIARRLIRMANEDIGMADPQAVSQCLAARSVYEVLGSPEGELALAQAVIYLATAPKSNAAYVAFKSAMKRAQETGSTPPPKTILNAPTELMKEQGYGAGYQYDPDTQDGFSGQNYFPDDVSREDFYKPVERGFERDILKRLAYWDKLRTEKGEG